MGKLKTLGEVTGLRPAAKIAADSARHSVDTFKRIRGLFASNDKTPAPPDYTEDTLPSDKFRQARSHYQMTDTDLLRAQANTYRQFQLYFWLTITALVLIGINFFYGVPLSGTLLLLSIFMISAALTFKAGFTNWIVRTRKIGVTPIAYLTSGDLFPVKYSSEEE
ncbi:hypothetical protein ACQU0X_27065 [Pseudovibrio ascidiaceicola]|uniref:hypothetical protein n=1 Tax=Pseudovibrio ascidiaceicola TaxID=285279 RepID=UPI003D36274D